MLTQSIKWRLQVWHGFLMTVLVTGLMTGFYAFEKRARLGVVDDGLREALMPLLPQLVPANPPPPPRHRRSPPGIGNRPPPRRPRPDRIPEMDGAVELSDFYYVLWSDRGDPILVSTNAPTGVPVPGGSEAAGSTAFTTRGHYREMAHVGIAGERLVLGTSIRTMQAELNTLAISLVVIGATIVMTGFTIGWILVTRALRPIIDISETARAIAVGDLSRRIDLTETESELGRLATVLNSTFARLESAFAQQHQFTSNAAHELRTPISVMLTQIQSTLNKPRNEVEYRETLEACLRAAQRMRRLTESLLELARFDAGQECLPRVRFDLGRIVTEAADMMTPLAGQNGVRLTTRLEQAECEGDPERLGQVVMNLISNAIKWSPTHGVVELELTVSSGTATFVVNDRGEGIPADDLPRVFERFYRADAARTDSAGSAGLGLAICRAIVEAHGGTIDADNRSEGGARFTVHLPIAAGTASG